MPTTSSCTSLPPSTESLRHFVVDNLSGTADVAVTETNLIFQHVQSHRVG